MEERGGGWGAGQPMPNHYTTESSLDEQEGKARWDDGILPARESRSGRQEEERRLQKSKERRRARKATNAHQAHLSKFIQSQRRVARELEEEEEGLGQTWRA